MAWHRRLHILVAVGLAWRILSTIAEPVAFLSQIEHATQTAVQLSRAIDKEDVSEIMAQALVEHPHAWVAWHYNLLNIRYWALALPYFSPALGLTLLTRAYRY